MNKIETVGKPYMRYLAKVIPLAFDESMSYYEQILSFRHYLLNEIMPAINNNAEALQELQEYIENLDLQDEVDNKLEEMYENGQLQSLIEEFLELSVTFTYDTINEMKEATNLVNGSYTKTLGYATINDGGASIYKVRETINTDVIDEKYLIALNDPSLVAELQFDNKININQINGANEDIGELINGALDKDITTFEFEPINYTIETPIEINNTICHFNFNNANVTCESEKMFDITCDNLHKVYIEELNVTGLDTNTFIDIKPTGTWGCSLVLKDSIIDRFLLIINSKSLFNSIIDNCQFRSDYGYFNLALGSADSGNMSNNNVFKNCYIRGYAKATANYPEYKFVMNQAKSNQFISCCFADCNTLFSLTNCRQINLEYCEIEDVTNVTNTKTGLIFNEVMLVNVTKYASDDTYYYTPSSDIQTGVIKTNSTNANVRNSVITDTTLPEYLSYAFNANNKYANLFSFKSNAIKSWIPINIIENKANNVTSLETSVGTIFSEQSGEGTLVTIYTKIKGSDGGTIYFKDRYICQSNSVILQCQQEKLYDSTWSSAVLYNATVTNSLNQYTLTTTSSVNCIIDVRVKFEKIGTDF